MTDNSGTVQACYSFTPYGKPSKLLGNLDAEFQYASYYAHQRSGLNLTLFRQYNATFGRWLSRDAYSGPFDLKPTMPEIAVDPNLFTYCFNNPVNFYDPVGLIGHKCCDQAEPEPSNSPSCQKYGGAGGSTYHGASETCVCRCMGDSEWAQKIRGCLACEASMGTEVTERHISCYMTASGPNPGGTATGLMKVLSCGLQCTGANSAW
jgi:RHS repeat-associated protein